MSCAICGREHISGEPVFTRYAFGANDGLLCERCAAPIRSAITRAVREMQRSHNYRIRQAVRELWPKGLRKVVG